jgi:hypothetical protein
MRSKYEYEIVLESDIPCYLYTQNLLLYFDYRKDHKAECQTILGYAKPKKAM